MATTKNTYTGNGSTAIYSFTFPYLEVSDIIVTVDAVVQTIPTEYILASPTTISFTTAPSDGASIEIKRVSSDDDLNAIFFPGSAIRARDLNENFQQLLYTSQETQTSASESSQESNESLAKSEEALQLANQADVKSDQALSQSSDALDAAAQAASDADAAQNSAAQAAIDASEAREAAEDAEQYAENIAELLEEIDLDSGVISVNGKTGVVSIGVEDLDDFAYYPASEQVTLLGPCVGDAGTFSGTEYISGSGSNLYFGFPKSNTQVYDVLSQLTDGDAVTVCYYSSVGTTYTEVETTFSSISNNGGTVPSWLVQFNDAVPGAVIGNYPVVFKSALITNGQAPITTGQVLVYDQITEKWRPEDIGGGGGGDYLPLTGGDLTGPLTSTSTATFIGDVTADKFIGDGSLLTNLPGGPTGDYLPLTGGDLTGPLTSTSTITAAGNIKSGTTGSAAGTYGGVLGVAGGNRGRLQIYSNTGDEPAIQILTAPDDATTKSEVFSVINNGSITAEGTFTVNNNGKFYRPTSKGGDVAGNALLTLVSDVNGVDSNAVSITTDGSITAAGEIKVEGASTPAGLWSGISKYGSLLIGTSSEAVGDAKVSIDSGSGSITAAGAIVSKGVNAAVCFQAIQTNESEVKAEITASGSATFAGRLISGSTNFGPTAVSTEAGLFYNNSSGQYPAVLARNMGGGTNFRGVNAVGGTTIDLNSGGDAIFLGTVTSANSFAIQLEADDPTKYDVTTEEYEETIRVPVVGGVGTADLVDGDPEQSKEKTVTRTREVRTYNGAVLDVKEELQALRTRATKQDETIAMMTEALRVMGADVSPFTSNK